MWWGSNSPSRVVEVRDRASRGLDGVSVTFKITAGNRTLSQVSASTDAQGRASACLTLDTQAGININQVTVTVPGVRSP